MKASEIVDKLKSVLLSADEEPQAEPAVEQEEKVELSVEEIEVNDEVELQEDDMSPEDVAEDVADEAVKYATKEELEAAVAEMKAMYEKVMEGMSSQEMEVEVPAEELSKDEAVELSSEEPAAEPLTHSPESKSEVKRQILSKGRGRTTMDVIYEKMFNK